MGAGVGTLQTAAAPLMQGGNAAWSIDLINNIQKSVLKGFEGGFKKVAKTLRDPASGTSRVGGRGWGDGRNITQSTAGGMGGQFGAQQNVGGQFGSSRTLGRGQSRRMRTQPQGGGGGDDSGGGGGGLAMAGAAFGGLGMVAAIAGGVLSVALDVVSASVKTRHQEIMKVAQTERPLAMISALGGSGRNTLATYNKDGSEKTPFGSAGILTQGAASGFKPAEAAQIGAGYYKSLGGQRSYMNPFALTLAGLSSDVEARFASTIGAGIGALREFDKEESTNDKGVTTTSYSVRHAGSHSSDVLGLGHSDGLRGQRLDEMLSRLTNTIQTLGEQNLRVDVGRQAQFLRQLRGSGHVKDAAFSGLDTVRTANSFAQMAMDGRGMLTNPFKQLAPMMLMSKAVSGGGSFQDILARAEGFAEDPISARKAILSFGKSSAEKALAGRGVSAKRGQIDRLLMGDLDAAKFSEYTGNANGGFHNKILAKHEIEKYNMVAKGQEKNKTILNSVHAIDKAQLTISDLDTVVTALDAVTTVLGKGTEILTKMDEVIGLLKQAF